MCSKHHDSTRPCGRILARLLTSISACVFAASILSAQEPPLECEGTDPTLGCVSGCEDGLCDPDEVGGGLCAAPLAQQVLREVANFLPVDLALIQFPNKINAFQEGCRDALLVLGIPPDKIQPIVSIPDAVDRISAEAVRRLRPVRVIICGHGSPGVIKIGLDRLNFARVGELAPLAGQVAHLTLFGCSAAAPVGGRSLPEEVAVTIHAPVKAWDTTVYAAPNRFPYPLQYRGRMLMHPGSKRNIGGVVAAEGLGRITFNPGAGNGCVTRNPAFGQSPIPGFPASLSLAARNSPCPPPQPSPRVNTFGGTAVTWYFNPNTSDYGVLVPQNSYLLHFAPDLPVAELRIDFDVVFTLGPGGLPAHTKTGRWQSFGFLGRGGFVEFEAVCDFWSSDLGDLGTVRGRFASAVPGAFNAPVDFNSLEVPELPGGGILSLTGYVLWRGRGASLKARVDDPANPPPAAGPCRLPGGPCVELDEAACAGAGGEWGGEGGECRFVPPVENLRCVLDAGGGTTLSWTNPAEAAPEDLIQIQVDGVTVQELPGNTTEYTIDAADMRAARPQVCVVSAGGIPVCASCFRTDESGRIASRAWLTLGPFYHFFDCDDGDEALLGEFLAPSRIADEYPVEGDAVDYDPAVAASWGYHEAAPVDAEGRPVWRRFDDGDGDGDLDLDAELVEEPNNVLAWLVTYVEYLGDAPVAVDLVVRSDEGVQLWDNDELVHNRNVCFDRDDVVTRDFEPGVHALKLGVWDSAGDWSASLRLVDAASGQTISDDPDLWPQWVFHGRERPEGFHDGPPVPVGTRFVRGDADSNGMMELTDALRILYFLFIEGVNPPPACFKAADADDNGRLELTDAVRILNYLFTGFGRIPPPSPSSAHYSITDCGFDPTEDEFDCATPSPQCRVWGGN